MGASRSENRVRQLAPDSKATKPKTNRQDRIRVKGSCPAQDLIHTVHRPPTDAGRALVSKYVVMGSCPRYAKNSRLSSQKGRKGGSLVTKRTEADVRMRWPQRVSPL